MDYTHTAMAEDTPTSESVQAQAHTAAGVDKWSRNYFPFFHTAPQELKDWVLLDNAGGAQCLKTVADRIT